MGLLRVLTDRGTEYCGHHDSHAYKLYLAINNIDYTKTKAKHPQTNVICKRFHKTVLQEFYQVTFRKKISTSGFITITMNVLIRVNCAVGVAPMQTFLEEKVLSTQKVDDLNQKNEEPIVS